MGQSRKRKTILSSQKPKKRWPVVVPSAKRFLLGSIVFGLLGFVGYRSFAFLASTALFSFEERPSLQAIRGLSDTEKTQILQKYRDLQSVNPQELESFSRGLYRSMGLRSIQLIQTAPDRIAIATEAFTPKLVAELDKLRFVADDGTIFGSMSTGESTALPILRGLYRSAPFIKSENETLIPNPTNQKIIDEALLAIHEAARYNIQYRSLTYDEFRGLSAEMLEPAYRITLGFRPFSDKYIKLAKIIESLKDRGLTSASIELDYKGKAFVKETTL
jgi:hypothetical protein